MLITKLGKTQQGPVIIRHTITTPGRGIHLGKTVLAFYYYSTWSQVKFLTQTIGGQISSLVKDKLTSIKNLWKGNKEAERRRLKCWVKQEKSVSLSLSVLAIFWICERILAWMDFLMNKKTADFPCHCGIRTEFTFIVGHLQETTAIF